MAQAGAGGTIDLEKELTCSICCDLLWQPLTLLDCLHTYCGSCLKEWFSLQANVSTSSSRAGSPYTCPSCRASVRAARPNANVTTLLDMYLQANPTKGKTEEEKAGMRAHYKPGDDVMPPVEAHPDSEDSEDERLLEDVMQMSVADLNPGVEANRRALRDRTNRDDDGSRRRRTRDAAANEARRRQDAVSRDITHQPSLRGLLSASELDPAAVQEVYDQILASGAFDGVDTDNLTPAQEEEFIERIAEAYRRQHRRRRDREHRAADQPADHVTTVLRPRDQAARPHLSEQWGQASVAGSTRSSSDRRRETSSHQTISGSTTPSVAPSVAPSPSVPPPQSTRTVSDPAAPVDAAQDRRRRAASARSNTDSFTENATSFSTMERITGPRRSETSIQAPEPPNASRQVHNSLSIASHSSHDIGQAPGMTGSQISIKPSTAMATSASQTSNLPYPTSDQPPGLQTTRSAQSLIPVQSEFLAEVKVQCSNCSRSDIQHELHYVCKTCDQGRFVLCCACYRMGKGCKYWFGFGYAADVRWKKSAPPDDQRRPPHILTPRRFLQNSRLDPQEGAFCEICFQYADMDLYWHCTTCLDGAWGYCSNCVQQDRHCTHPLTPVARAKTHEDMQKITSGALRAIPLPHLVEAAHYFSPPTAQCAICRTQIPAHHTRLHCPQCSQRDGYEICNDSYRSLEATGKIAPSDGIHGGRKCLQSHPMSVVQYRDLTSKIQQRVVVSQATRGHNAEHSNKQPSLTSNAHCLALWSWWPADTVEDELAFPRWAEITDVEQINADYFLGSYAGSRGLFPANHVRIL